MYLPEKPTYHLNAAISIDNREVAHNEIPAGIVDMGRLDGWSVGRTAFRPADNR